MSQDSGWNAPTAVVDHSSDDGWNAPGSTPHVDMSGFRRRQKGVNDATSRIIDLLQRPGQAHAAFVARGGTLGRVVGDPITALLNPGAALAMDPNVLFHGESPEQQSKDLATIEQRYGIPHNWLADMLTGTLEDPTTAIGGSGASRAAFEGATEHGLPALIKAWQKGAAHSPLMHDIGTISSGVHDFITPGGHNAAHALRTLALKDGRQGVQTYQALYGMRGAAEHSATDVTQALTTGFRRALAGLDNGERLQVFRAIDAGTIESLPAKLKTAASDVQRYDRAIPWLGGSASLRKQMTTHGYSLPEDLQRFDQGPRGVISADQFRANHVPGTHEPDDAAGLLTRYEMGLRSSKDLTQSRNVQFRSRDNRVPITDPRAVEEAFEGSFRRAGKQIAAADLRKTLAQRYAPIKEVQRSLPADDAVIERAIQAYNASDPLASLSRASFDKLSPSVQELLTRPFQATKTVRPTKRFPDVPQEIQDFFERPGGKMPDAKHEQELLGALGRLGGKARDVSDVSRGLMFTTPFQHPMRIASLLLGHAPEQIPKAIEKYIRTGAGLAGPETRDKVLGDSARAGASGAGNADNLSKLQNALIKIPFRIGDPLAWWFGKVQKMVWGFDDAAKSALFEKYVKRYGDPYRAAYHVQHDMVDYGASSPMTEAARTISSFPTWRTRMPVAVARALAKNPHLFAMMARSAPALLGARFGDNDDKKLTSTALGEGIGAGNELDKYVRGSLSPSTRIGIDLAQRFFHGRGDWATYGIDPLTFGAKTLPGASLLSPLFPSTPEEELLFQLFGIESLDDTPKPRRRRSHHRAGNE